MGSLTERLTLKIDLERAYGRCLNPLKALLWSSRCPGEANFNLTGFLIMCCAETAEATRLVLTQRLLCNLKFGAFEGLYLMAPICALWMWGLALFIEVPRLVRSGDHIRVVENLDMFLGAAVLGFAVNVASFLVRRRRLFPFRPILPSFLPSFLPS